MKSRWRSNRLAVSDSAPCGGVVHERLLFERVHYPLAGKEEKDVSWSVECELWRFEDAANRIRG